MQNAAIRLRAFGDKAATARATHHIRAADLEFVVASRAQCGVLHLLARRALTTKATTGGFAVYIHLRVVHGVSERNRVEKTMVAKKI
jgi:hypothetical protein